MPGGGGGEALLYFEKRIRFSGSLVINGVYSWRLES